MRITADCFERSLLTDPEHACKIFTYKNKVSQWLIRTVNYKRGAMEKGRYTIGKVKK